MRWSNSLCYRWWYRNQQICHGELLMKRFLPIIIFALLTVACLTAASDFQTINDGQGANRVHGIGATFIPGSFPSPAGTTSTAACVMMGLGSSAAITPVSTGRIHIDVTFGTSNNTGGDGSGFGVKIGTGTAPINGAAITGTDIGPACGQYQWVSATANASQIVAIGGNFIGTVGTAYWIDVSLEAVTGGTAAIGKAKITAYEF